MRQAREILRKGTSWIRGHKLRVILLSLVLTIAAHWPESGVIIYTDFFKKTKAIETPRDAMLNDVALFKKEGSVVQPVRKPSVKSNIGGLVAEVYHFGPDKRGQYDARAYFTYEGYIDYFVLTARDKATFDRSLAAFHHVLRSYAPQLKVRHEPAKKT